MKTPDKSKQTSHSKPADTRGLTLEEIRMRMMVNSMKIKIERQRFLTTVLPGVNPMESPVVSGVSRFKIFMRYATLVVTSYRIFKKASYFFNSFRNNK